VETHCRLIEKKISRYLDFIRSGQLVESFPNAPKTPIQVRLSYQFPPSDSASRFLTAAQKQLAELGIAFSHGMLPSGY